jgi:hypothetical protein
MANDKDKNTYQFAQNSFNRRREHMKDLLDMVRVICDDDNYPYYKRQIMEFTYSDLEDDFQMLVDMGDLQKCECNASLRHGWSECPYCSGAGYRQKEDSED